jgi:hypothetical protein
VSWATILELPAKGGASSFYQSAESRLIHINEPQIIPTLPYNPEATSAASAHSHIRFVMTGALCNDRWQTKKALPRQIFGTRLAALGRVGRPGCRATCSQLREPVSSGAAHETVLRGHETIFWCREDTPKRWPDIQFPIKQRGAIMWKPLTLLYREYCRLYRWHCRARVAEIRKYNFTRSA